MDRLRLVDLIPEDKDRLAVRNEWTWLMEPFIEAFHLGPETAATKAYVTVESSVPSLKYLSAKIEAMLRLGITKDALSHNIDVLKDAWMRPILLVGEPGVGKTTWMLHFFTQELIEKKSYYYRLDAATIRPALADLDVVSYMKHRLREGIMQSMRKKARKLNIKVSVDELARNERDTLAIESAIRETAITLLANHQTGWVLLDNLDHRPREVQDLAVEYGANLCDIGLRVIVPVRPYTINSVHVMDDLRCVAVPSPSIAELIRMRIDYALASKLGKDLVGQMRLGHGVNLTWTNGLVEGEEGLVKVWQSVATSLGQLELLRDHLFYIHRGDLHEITNDLRELMMSGYFCEEMMRRLRGDTSNEHEFLTAYFRGAYKHHRHTQHSGGRIVNVYDAPEADRRHKLLVIRFLQFLRRYSDSDRTEGVQFRQLKVDMERFGYNGDKIRAIGEFLIKKRLVLEIGRLMDWHAPAIYDDDKLILSEAGHYYLERLVKNSRYIQAMADVTFMDRDRVMQMKMWARSADDNFCNTCLFLEHVADVLEEENERLAREGLLETFLGHLDVGGGFFFSGVVECYNRARDLRQQSKLSFEVMKSWEELYERATKIRALRVQRARAG